MIRVRKMAALSAVLVLSSGVSLLTGCSMGVMTGAGDSAPAAITLSGAHIQGRVHGGVYPIQGANIELWQTGTGAFNTATGSYAPAFLNSNTNTNYIASAVSATQGDNTGLAPGYFDFGTSSLTCTPGSFVYLTTTGGGTIPGKTNSSVVQVAMIGQCPASASQAAYFNNVNVYLSETSTVAAAYTLGNFISVDTDPKTNLQRVNITAPTDNTATGSCTVTNAVMTCTAAGLAHGVANAINLVDFVTFNGTLPTGAARATLPGNSQAVAPQAMVNTLGNVLQSCVDSGPSTVSSPSSTCSTLLGYAPSSAAGTAPTNTLQVALNLATRPTTNVTSLYALQTQNSPFSPMMSAAPTAFSLSVFYPAAAIGDPSFTAPVDVALDSQDNVYVAYSQNATQGATQAAVGSLAELSAAGTQVFSAAAPTLPQTLANPGTVAIDAAGNAWVTDDTNNVGNLTTLGNAVGFYTSVSAGTKTVGSYNGKYTVPYGKASGIAFDQAGNAFITRDATDRRVNDYLYAKGSLTNTQAGTFEGTSLLRAQVDAYGTFYAVGSNAFLSFAPEPCGATRYAESSATLDAAGGNALAIDNHVGNYTAFLPITQELATANVTIAAGQNQCWTATTTTNDYAGSVATNSAPLSAVLDGSGNLFWAGKQGKLYSYLKAESYETTTGGTMTAAFTSFTPCYLGSATSCTYASSLAGLAADSSGALWYAVPSAGGTAYLVQTFGLAQPTWPLLAYAHSGVAF